MPDIQLSFSRHSVTVFSRANGDYWAMSAGTLLIVGSYVSCVAVAIDYLKDKGASVDQIDADPL